MTRNTGWGSSSAPRTPSLSSGWSQDHLPATKPELMQVNSPGIGKVSNTEASFIENSRATLVELFGEDFKSDPRYAQVLAEVLENKRPVHMILADYRPRGNTPRGGAGW